MNVVFRVDSSTKIGTGHVMRCMTLADKLKREKQANIFFVMRKLEGNLISVVKSHGFKVRILPNAGHDTRLDGYAAWLTVPQNIDAEQSIKIISEIGTVNLLIIDSYAIDIKWERLVRKYVNKIMVVDDLANRKHDCDILLDQNLYEEMDKRYLGLVPKNCILYLGPRYALLRQEFYEAKRKMQARTGELKNILVFFGGVDATNETSKTLKALMMLNNKDLEINVVVGNANPNKEEVKLLCNYSDKWHYYCQVNNMAELMAKADLAIGAGGTATWERCYLGLPSIVIAVAENQIEISKCCETRYLIKYLGINSNISVENIMRAIFEFNKGNLLKMSQHCEGLISDKNGFKELFETC